VVVIDGEKWVIRMGALCTSADRAEIALRVAHCLELFWREAVFLKPTLAALLRDAVRMCLSVQFVVSVRAFWVQCPALFLIGGRLARVLLAAPLLQLATPDARARIVGPIPCSVSVRIGGPRGPFLR